MLRSLFVQLLHQHSSVPQVVLDLNQKHRHENPPREGLLNALKVVVENTNQTYLIVDALDECSSTQDERDSLIAILGSFKDFGLANFHILGTSQKEHYLSKWSEMVSFPPIGIQNLDVDNDISLHVQRQLLNDPKLSL